MLETEKYPESCHLLASCYEANLAFAGYAKMVGEKTFENQLSGCVCGEFKYGLVCDLDDAINSDGVECINGVHDPQNKISGCACTDESGKPTPFHGWYCDVPNFKLCNSDQFYVHEKTKTVADTFNGCSSCGLATNMYCKTCIQLNEEGILFISI